jgi:hypothetical protein
MIDFVTLTSNVMCNMGLREDSLDANYKKKIANDVKTAVLEFKAAGVIEPAIESQIGVTAIAIICNDLLNVESGNIKISKAYMYYIPILQALTKEDLIT